MKLLVLTTRLFQAPSSGGEVCTARLLQMLRQAGHDITLMGRGNARDAAGWATRVVSLGSVEPAFDELSPQARFLAVAGALLRGAAITVHRQGGQSVHDAVAARLPSHDAVIVDHLQAWPWLGARFDRPVMLVQHNVESDNYRRRSRAANRGYQGNARSRPLLRALMHRESRLLLSLELDALLNARVVACLADADAARLRELCVRTGAEPAARLEVLPGFAQRSVQVPSGHGTAGLPRVGLLGTWTWAPNREGLDWFLKQVWPALQGQAQLVLAGSGLDGVALPPGTRMLGRVPDVMDFVRAVDLIAVPSLSGSGVQEKAIEAVATGLPVVATRHALRGLGDGLPSTVHPVADAGSFAAACLHALSSTSAADREAAQEQAERWSEQRQWQYRQALIRCLGDLAPRPGPQSTGLVAVPAGIAD